MEKEAKTYMIIYLLTPLIPEEKVEEEANAVRSSIEKNHGIIIYEEKPKNQKLSYNIKKFDRAYLGMIKFFSQPELIADLENFLKKNDKIIRSSIYSTKAVEKKIFRPKRIISKPKTEKTVPIQVEEIDRKLEEILKE